MNKVKPIVKKFKSYEAAERWDIEQQISMSHGERQRVAKALKIRVYGKKPPDVRDIKYSR